MKLGLPYIAQIQGSAQAVDASGNRVPTTSADGQPDEQAPAVELGWREALDQRCGWIAQTCRQLVASISTGYATEHNDNDTHKDIHADSISERGRTVANGVWVDVPFNPANFVGSGAMTVAVATQTTYAYMLVGKTMTVSFILAGITIGGTPDTLIMVKIPAGYVSKRATPATFFVVDNGTLTTGWGGVQAQSSTQVPYIVVHLTSGANWQASAALTQAWGTVSFEVQ